MLTHSKHIKKWKKIIKAAWLELLCKNEQGMDPAPPRSSRLSNENLKVKYGMGQGGSWGPQNNTGHYHNS